MKGLYIIERLNGKPDLGGIVTSHTYDGDDGQFGLYMIADTAPNLNTIRDLAQAIELSRLSESVDEHRPELDLPIQGTVRIRFNQWLTDNHPDWPQIQPGAKFRDAVGEIAQRMNPAFDWNIFDVADV